MGLFKDLMKPHGIYFSKSNDIEYCPKCDGKKSFHVLNVMDLLRIYAILVAGVVTKDI